MPPRNTLGSMMHDLLAACLVFLLFERLVDIGCVAAENLALGRPTYQLGTGWGGASDRAVDGNKNPDFFAGSCTHTLQTNNPWWAVDLGESYIIGGVELTNRKHSERRLRDFHIGVTDTSPADLAPQIGNFHIGHTYSGIMPNSASEILPCSDCVGRYVVVYLPHSNTALTLCEVEVYEGFCPSPLLYVSPEAEGTVMSAPYRELHVGSSGHCAMYCYNDHACGSFNILASDVPGSVVCQLNGVGGSLVTVAEGRWYNGQC